MVTEWLAGRFLVTHFGEWVFHLSQHSTNPAVTFEMAIKGYLHIGEMHHAFLGQGFPALQVAGPLIQLIDFLETIEII